ncbi:MAG: shikimate dehydrogenase, partial [Candidatus Peregrinibacteria bacterium]|nr:shikimate dehydrogenase [Candidatus Peregrinibacteria bacterium]
MKKFCVIGHPIKHSKSPVLHQAGFVEFELEAEFNAVDVAPENLENWVKNDFANDFDGAAVTIPHKENIRKFINLETEAAQKIGAVNTLFKQDGVICGTNTDGIGALKAIQTEILNLKDKKVLILGAGGASRAIIFALKTAGAQV